MNQRRRSIVGREHANTPFGATLLRLCDGTGAVGSALVDREGETVDYAGPIDSYEIRVAAAEWRIVLRELESSLVPNWADTTEILIRSRKRSYAIVSLVEGYAVVMQLLQHCFRISRRALNESVREICREAGLDVPVAFSREHWTRVEVRPLPKDKRRPASVWIGSSWSQVELLGRYESRLLETGEVGFRARLANGEEVNLVRERMGRWYAEDLLSS
jgi:hypothetical protein